MKKVDEFLIVDPNDDIVYGTCEVYECPVDRSRWIGNRRIYPEYQEMIEKRLKLATAILQTSGRP
jgi:hypothetical protein